MPTHTRLELVWVRYNPRSALLSPLGLSPAAELAHRRLCDYIWSGATSPAPDFSKAGGLLRVPRESWESVMEELQSVGWRTRNGQLFNPAVASVLREARVALAAHKALSKAGNAARWSSRTPPDGTPVGHPVALHSTVSKQYSTGTVQTRLTAERLTLSSSPPKEGDDREKAFLEELQAILQGFSPVKAAAESKNWGGWWRNRFRENPAKARRVLAELAGMVQERRIQRNPGAAGLDLWNRLP
jgi:hypothetical protein